MDNNVIASVNLMMVYTSHKVGHKNNLPCLAVDVNAIAELCLHSIENKTKD